MLAETQQTKKRVPLVLYLDDDNERRNVMRAFFVHKGIVFREVCNLVETWQYIQERKPTLLLVNTALNTREGNMSRLYNRSAFQAISALNEYYRNPRLMMVSIAQYERQDDLIDSQLGGCIEHHDFSYKALEHIVELSFKLLNGNTNTPGGYEDELLDWEQIEPAQESMISRDGGGAPAPFPGAGEEPKIARRTVEGNDLQALRTMMYGVVREVLEDVLYAKKKVKSEPPPPVVRQISAYQVN